MNKYRPSAITLQETKLSKPGMIKLPGYQVFEQNRKNRRGGGLLTAVDEDTNPVLISTSKEDNEILTIQADLGQEKLRIINAYGPQEDDGNQKVLGFWQDIEAEIMNAENNDSHYN
jgi:exonuclease III